MSKKVVVFRAHLLLGDMIYASCVISKYRQDHPEDKIIVECLDEYPQEILNWIPGVELTYATDTQAGDAVYYFDPTAAMHLGVQKNIPIWKAMGELMGLPALDVPALHLPQYEIPKEWENAFVISPFSRSCTSHTINPATGDPYPANKTLSTLKWLPIIRYMRRRGKVLFVGAEGDRLDGLALDESERVAGYPLSLVASVMQRARAVISVDNGLARLATLAGAPTLILFPDVLPVKVFSPIDWSPKVVTLRMNVQTTDVFTLTAGIKHVLRMYSKVL